MVSRLGKDETGEMEKPPLNSTPQQIPQPSTSYSIHPSYVMFGVSFPFFIRAYRLYSSPLESLIEKATNNRGMTIAELKEADVGVRRAVGVAVAGRALRLATLVSFGSFGIFSAALFFVCDWKSMQDALSATRRWGNVKRKKLDHLLGVKERFDEDHPEVIARQNMTREKEIEYLAKSYLKATSSDNNEKSE